MGTVVETDARAARCCCAPPATACCYDTGHSTFSGGDPLALIKAHVSRVVHVHCKDARKAVLERARAEDMSFMGAVMEGIFTVPGDGSIDYPSILRVLADNGYSGWLVVEAEQDPNKANPLTYATMGFQNLSRMARQAGFDVIE